MQWESPLYNVTSKSKSKEESGEAGAESLICEYTEMLWGVLGHWSRLGSRSSIGLSLGKSLMSIGMEERGSGRRPLMADTGVETMKWLLGEGGTEPADDHASCGTVSSWPSKPAPSAAFASSASRSSVACSIAERPGEHCIGGGGGGRVGTRYERRLRGNVGSS